MYTYLHGPKAGWLAILALTLLTATRAHAGKETVLHTFSGGADGANPSAGLIQDSAGNLYGTTFLGGTGGGVVFELIPKATGRWTETLLHTFTNSNDGLQPSATLVFDAGGNLYGTTHDGASGLGYGVVFELSPPAVNSGSWTYKVLYRFTGGGDGGNPNGLILDSKGNLWGTTGGGTLFGSIFEMVPGSGGTWSFRLRWIFSGTNEGEVPFGDLALDSHGTFYGTTVAGGALGYGTVYQFKSVSGNGMVSPLPIYAFTGGNDGAYPVAGVVLDAAGNLYGTTGNRGADNVGTVYTLHFDSTNGWTEQTLHTFTGGNDGANPAGGLIFNKTGSLFGAATNGGTFTYGAIFRLTPESSGAWAFETIKAFTGGRDGASPNGDLIFDAAGHLYGTTGAGGAVFGFGGYGVVFQLTP